MTNDGMCMTQGDAAADAKGGQSAGREGVEVKHEKPQRKINATPIEVKKKGEA